VECPLIVYTALNDLIGKVIAETDMMPLGSSSRPLSMIHEQPCTAAITGIE
jgi:hypothetical protein